MALCAWKQTTFAVVVTLVSITAVALGLVQNGTIRGVVADQSGAEMPRALVEARDEATGIHFAATTDSSGGYVFPSLPVGSYTLSATADGFERAERPHVQVDVAER